MTEPTDADRKHAAELIYGSRPRDQVEAVARALAGERERAVIALRRCVSAENVPAGIPVTPESGDGE